MSYQQNPQTYSILNISESQKDFLSGSLGGASSVLLGYPFETIKTRMQIMKENLISSLKNKVVKEGITSLYKGVSIPLLNAPLFSAISYSTYGMMKRGMNNYSNLDRFHKNLFAGALTGLVMSSIFTPFENLKCYLQIENLKNSQKKSTFELIQNRISQTGFKGIYRGLFIGLMRDIPGSALIFTFYEFFKESLTKYDTKAINFLAGGLASFCTWIFTYPQDMIKTRFLYQDRAILKDITHQIFIENGVKGFYRGVNIVMLRSLLTGSISFFMMENCKNLLQRQNN